MHHPALKLLVITRIGSPDEAGLLKGFKLLEQTQTRFDERGKPTSDLCKAVLIVLRGDRCNEEDWAPINGIEKEGNELRLIIHNAYGIERENEVKTALLAKRMPILLWEKLAVNILNYSMGWENADAVVYTGAPADRMGLELQQLGNFCHSGSEDQFAARFTRIQRACSEGLSLRWDDGTQAVTKLLDKAAAQPSIPLEAPPPLSGLIRWLRHKARGEFAALLNDLQTWQQNPDLGTEILERWSRPGDNVVAHLKFAILGGGEHDYDDLQRFNGCCLKDWAMNRKNKDTTQPLCGTAEWKRVEDSWDGTPANILTSLLNEMGAKSQNAAALFTTRIRGLELNNIREWFDNVMKDLEALGDL